MTTIAYRDGMIAANGLTTEEGLIVSTTSIKIGRLGPSGRGILFGAAGESSWGWSFRSWLQGGARGEAPHRHDSADEGFVVMPNGGIVSFLKAGQNWGAMELLRTPIYAIGSGAKLALGAMLRGATADQAVRKAAERDAYTGGKIRVLRR